MGIAASQARYLYLTARQTNVEFEGQQINQARTNLANEESGLFRQMLEIKAPTLAPHIEKRFEKLSTQITRSEKSSYARTLVKTFPS